MVRKVLVFLYVIGGAFLVASCTTEKKPEPISPAYFTNPALVREVQIALRNRGYYSDSADGFLGPSTAEAIQLY
ncbi:MAG: peptidoglycan-binding protein [Verrucomicrobia bacterium]|nr:peptidoglycan-binding protein [Verrucomicrobiota bacterium]